MKILVLGGDGFCGWPTSLHLSRQGHEVVIVDNLSRRAIDIELGVESLTPIATIQERVKVWNEITERDLRFENIDIAAEYDKFVAFVKDESPDTIIHFAEQRAAPYSMKSAKHKNYTVNNNLGATNNVLNAIVESEKNIHLVHLGTMGVYGYGTVGMKIPEGYLNVKLETENGLVDKEILYPANPGFNLPPDQDTGSAFLRLLQQKRWHKNYRSPSGYCLGHTDSGYRAGRKTD